MNTSTSLIAAQAEIPGIEPPASVNQRILAALARIDAILFWRNFRMRFLPSGKNDTEKLIREYHREGLL